MTCRILILRAMAAALLTLCLAYFPAQPGFAQEQAAAADSSTAEPSPEPLTEDELEVLVARIALYPDELVAVIAEASLFPLQIVEASRFLDRVAKDPGLKPKESWDGSVISLLNYPEIVRMMSDDLDWTQTLGDAMTYQQKDVLVAIQQLRDRAVAAGAIRSDDKIKVSETNDNVVIQSASPDVVYVPQYEPEMLYAPDYQIAPISYYPDPYPYYFAPTATYFAGAVTGAIWGAAMDWDNWGVWGGRWDGGDVNIDCNKCFNDIDFNGKINFNDVDWKNVDRSKIKFDRDQFNKIDRAGLRDRVKADNRNSLRSKSAEIRKERPNALPDRPRKVSDVRKSTLDGLKAKAGESGPVKRDIKRPSGATANVDRSNITKAKGRIERPVGKPRPAARLDNRPKKVSGLGSVKSGKREKVASRRGGKSMGGGIHARGGGSHKAIRRGGGGRRR
jgi:hypothetical protein